ncbi:MAG: hypoxanthine phosphoribosyltransferase [Bacteroidota bacterium]
MSTTVQLHDLYFVPYIEEAKIQQRVLELGAALATKFADKQPIFLAILNGSYVFAADLMRACEFDHEVTFIKLTSYEGTKTTGRITTQIGLKENLADRHVIIVEDIIDTGTTIHHFLPTLKKEKPASTSIISFLSKPDALKFPLKIDYIGFEIPNKFVVGYGLDYNGLGRNLKSIYQLSDDKKMT